MKPEELKEIVGDALGEHAEKLSGLEKSYKDVDGKLAHMAESIKAGKESSIDKDAFQQLDAKAQKNEQALEKANAALEDIAKKMQMGFGGGASHQKSMGEIASESERLKAYEGGSLVLGEYKGHIFEKAITSVVASAGELIQPQRDRDIVRAPFEQLPMRDLLMTVPVSTNAVEWIQLKLSTNNAAPVAEGELKPTSDLTYEPKTTSIITLAHLYKASKQVLDDARQLMGEINTEGLFGIREVENSQLLIGSGAGGNLHGLIPQATAYDAALNASGDTKIDQVRKAILQLTKNKYNASALLLNPVDWSEIELHKTTTNEYLFTNPITGVGARLWGRPVRESLSMTEGEFLLGAFNRAATLYDRERVNVRISDENNDDFEKNMLTVRIEERIGLAVKRPLALITGTLAATP